MTNYNEYTDMIVKASKHAVNAVFLMKSKRGSELPSKWNNWDIFTNTITIDDKSDTITFKTASGYVDNVSRDDLEQIASLAICEELACAESTKQFEYDELFEIAFIAIRRKVVQVQYNTHGRYIAKLKSSKAIQTELEKANQTDLVNAIVNKTDKAVTIAKKAGIDIYDRTTGPAYNQARMIENRDYENLQTRIYQNEKEEYILSHMKPELARIYAIYKDGFEPCNSKKSEVTAEYIRKKMNYGNSISRQTINNRVNEMKSSYAVYAKEFDILSYNGESERAISNTGELIRLNRHKTEKVVLNIIELNKIHAKSAEGYKNVADHEGYYTTDKSRYIPGPNHGKGIEWERSELKALKMKIIRENNLHTNIVSNNEFKPAIAYKIPQITSISDVKGWSPTPTKNVKSNTVIPIETLVSALKSKKTSEASKKDIADYLIKHYPKESVNAEISKIKSKKVSENILAIVVSTHDEK